MFRRQAYLRGTAHLQGHLLQPTHQLQNTRTSSSSQECNASTRSHSSPPAAPTEVLAAGTVVDVVAAVLCCFWLHHVNVANGFGAFGCNTFIFLLVSLLVVAKCQYC